MARYFSALLAGLVFGVGLTVSQMVDPSKVLGFLDLFGQWDPSLAFVMGGALLVTAIGYRVVTRKEKPLFEDEFQLPTNKSIDPKLAAGSVLFGVGWGLVGLCPGPALAALTIGGLPVIVFIIAMAAGAFAYQLSGLSGD